MEITCYSISTFRSQIEALIKKKKDGYTSVLSDICNEIDGKSIEELRITPKQILQIEKEQIRTIKARCSSSNIKQSKSNGYRFIYLVHLNKSEIVLLYVFPKRGNQGITNINHTFLVNLIKTYTEEKESLVQHNLCKGLDSI